MKKIIFATGNSHKLREASEILGPGFGIVSAAEAGVTEEIPETGSTLAENALQKALYLSSRTGEMCFADDTGLEVDALGGAPGVYSARYAGPGHDSEANMDKLLSELSALGPGASRRARFVTHIALIFPDGSVHGFEGMMQGEIAAERSGCGGFGYDPVFIPDEIPSSALTGGNGADGQDADVADSGCSEEVGSVLQLGENGAADGLGKCGELTAGGAAACGKSCAGGTTEDWKPSSDAAAEDCRLVLNSGRLTVSEISEEAKNAISHRGRAMRAMAAWLRSQQELPEE